MKIVFDLSFNLHGGSASHAKGFIQFFARSSEVEQLIVYSALSNRFQLEEFLDNPKVKIIFLKIWSPVLPFRICWQQLILPILLCNYGRCYLFSPGNISPFFKLNPFAKVVVWVATIGPFCKDVYARLDWRKKILFFLNRMFMSISMFTADHVIHESEFSHKLLSCFGSRRKHSVILAGKPNVLNGSTCTWSNRDGSIVLVSHLYPYKFVEFVIQQFSLSTKANSDIELHIYGGFPDINYKNKLENLIAQKQLGDRVFLKGQVTFDELVEVYVSCRFMIFSSLCESSGYTLIEAMSLGVPILASDRTAIPYTCGKGVAYFSYDDNSLSLLIKEWIVNPDVRYFWSKRALERAEQLPSFFQAGERFLHLLKKVR